MTSIKWRKEFETGIQDVDQEHAHLIEVVNAVVHRVGDKPSKSQWADALGEIHRAISSHFAHEEKIMEERGYDQYEDHKADHEFLLDEIRGILNSVDENVAMIQRDVLVRRISCWFTEHFKTRDARLHRKLG